MEIIKFIQHFSSPFLDTFFQGVTMLGEDYFLMLLAALIFWCFHKEFGYRLGFTYLSGTELNIAVKEIFMIPRPIGTPGIRSLRLETAGGYSFPSGHTQCAALFYTSIMTWFRKPCLYWAGGVFIFLVALSRLYLGVHWPIDVIGGALLGIVWVFFSNWLFNYAETTGKKSIFLIVIIPILLGIFFFPTTNYFKTAGAALGFFCGYLIEPRFIRYKVEAPLLKQILKYLFGIIFLVAIRLFIKKLLPETPFSDFIRYFLMSIWVTILAPVLFMRFKIFHN